VHLTKRSTEAPIAVFSNVTVAFGGSVTFGVMPQKEHNDMDGQQPNKSEALQLSMLLMIASQLDQLLHKRPLTEEIRDYYLKTADSHAVTKDAVAAYMQQYSEGSNPKL